MIMMIKLNILVQKSPLKPSPCYFSISFYSNIISPLLTRTQHPLDHNNIVMPNLGTHSEEFLRHNQICNFSCSIKSKQYIRHTVQDDNEINVIHIIIENHNQHFDIMYLICFHPRG